jgi:site-specific recombinase XerD
MTVFRRGAVYWFKFTFNGELIQRSSKVLVKREAEKIAAAYRTQLANNKVGLMEQRTAPMVKEFAEEFMRYVETHMSNKPNTVKFYRQHTAVVAACMGKLRLDAITDKDVTRLIESRQEAKLATSTVNRALASLRRMLHYAVEKKRIATLPVHIRLLRGEHQRERVLNESEESRYLESHSATIARSGNDYARLRPPS